MKSIRNISSDVEIFSNIDGPQALEEWGKDYDLAIFVDLILSFWKHIQFFEIETWRLRQSM